MFYYDFEGAVCFRYRNAENLQQKRKTQENPLDCPPQETLFNDRTESIVITLFLIVLPLLDYFVSFIGVSTAVTLRQGLIMHVV